jgi:hypothetical protein
MVSDVKIGTLVEGSHGFNRDQTHSPSLWPLICSLSSGLP